MRYSRDLIMPARQTLRHYCPPYIGSRYFTRLLSFHNDYFSGIRDNTTPWGKQTYLFFLKIKATSTSPYPSSFAL